VQQAIATTLAADFFAQRSLQTVSAKTLGVVNLGLLNAVAG